VTDEEQEPSMNDASGPDDGGNGPDAATADPLSEARAEAQRYKEQLLRTAADLDNFRKRSRRELSDAERQGREELLRDILPVFDNLERATAHAETATDVQSLADGIQMVMKQFVDTLERAGIHRIATTGKPFDPAVHEAIQHLETAQYPPGSVAAEVQAGYRTPDRLVRPALVVVAKAPPGVVEAPAADAEPGEMEN
jgi:molecular chaperone GrpE